MSQLPAISAAAQALEDQGSANWRECLATCEIDVSKPEVVKAMRVIAAAMALLSDPKDTPFRIFLALNGLMAYLEDCG